MPHVKARDCCYGEKREMQLSTWGFAGSAKLVSSAVVLPGCGLLVFHLPAACHRCLGKSCHAVINSYVMSDHLQER